MRRNQVLSIVLCVAMMFGAGSIAGLVAQAQSGTNAAKRGAEILSEATAAAGGERVKKLESIEFKSAGDVNTPMGPTTVEVEVVVAYPDKVRTENALAIGTILTGFDGKSAWISSAQGTFDLPADLIEETGRSINLIGGFGLYKKSLAGKAEAEFIGEKEVAGQKTWLVEWNGPTGKVKLYFDAAAKMLVAAKYRALTMQGAVEEERRWSDFREVEGVKFPYRWVTYRDGSLFSDQTVTEVKINPTVDAGVFAKPQ
ncbi:MAG: hypothetical protein HY234_11005 [Acidobacteria bacterium]|nr:hypothetical protein [Acidobacteriota bacterium]